jgi:Na+/H+-translocating membrane pyrophosphatase
VGALATIISLGTIAGALIPEFTKVFTSTESRHVKEVVTSSKQGGASLNILSGFVAGQLLGLLEGLVILGLMFGAYLISAAPPSRRSCRRSSASPRRSSPSAWSPSASSAWAR